MGIVGVVLILGVLSLVLYYIFRPCNKTGSCDGGTCSGKSAQLTSGTSSNDGEADEEVFDAHTSADVTAGASDVGRTTLGEEFDMGDDDDLPRAGDVPDAARSAIDPTSHPEFGPASATALARANRGMVDAEDMERGDLSMARGMASGDSELLDRVLDGGDDAALDQLLRSTRGYDPTSTSRESALYEMSMGMDGVSGGVGLESVESGERGDDTVYIPMSDADEARARSAFDVSKKLPGTYFEDASTTEGRAVREAKLRELAERFPDRAYEILKNVSGAFVPTEKQVKRLHRMRGSMRPDTIYVSPHDPSRNITTALRHPVATSDRVSEDPPKFRTPLSFLASKEHRRGDGRAERV